MAISYASYDYWNLNLEWFVAGHGGNNVTSVQFSPTRPQMIRAIQHIYPGSDSRETLSKVLSEASWHQRERELV
jgi:hypothetical protein